MFYESLTFWGSKSAQVARQGRILGLFINSLNNSINNTVNCTLYVALDLLNFACKDTFQVIITSRLEVHIVESRMFNSSQLNETKIFINPSSSCT